MAALQRWRRRQSEERPRAGELWQTAMHDGSPVELVFTTETGGLVRRQHIDTMLRRAGSAAGLDTKHLGTHVGRRTVVTTLYAAGVELADIARHVGHASTSTTAGYVAHLGDRPARTAEVAARLLDPALEGSVPVLANP